MVVQALGDVIQGHKRRNRLGQLVVSDVALDERIGNGIQIGYLQKA